MSNFISYKLEPTWRSSTTTETYEKKIECSQTSTELIYTNSYSFVPIKSNTAYIRIKTEEQANIALTTEDPFSPHPVFEVRGLRLHKVSKNYNCERYNFQKIAQDYLKGEKNASHKN